MPVPSRFQLSRSFSSLKKAPDIIEIDTLEAKGKLGLPLDAVFWEFSSQEVRPSLECVFPITHAPEGVLRHPQAAPAAWRAVHDHDRSHQADRFVSPHGVAMRHSDQRSR
jgi:hypothetical protein